MAVIANLDIILGAQTGKAEKQLKGASSVLNNLRSTVLKVAAAYLSFAAAQRIVGALFERAQAIDAMAKQADLLGVSIDNLQALAIAADLAGAEYDTTVKAIERMNRVMGEAAKGGKAQQAAFDAIGVSLDSLRKKSPVERFFAVGEALKAQRDPALIAAAANDIFGKSWASVGTLMLGGAQQLKDAQQNVQKFGLSMSRIDAAKIEAALDALTLLGRQLGAINQRVLPAFAAGLQTLLDAFEGVQKFFNEFSLIDLPKSTSRIALWIGTFLSFQYIAPKIIRAIHGIQKAVLSLGAASVAAVPGGKIGKAALEMAGKAALFVGSFVAADLAIDHFNNNLEELAVELEKSTTGGDAFKEAMASVEELDAMGKAAEDAKKLADAQEDAAKKTEQLADAMKQRGADLAKSLRTPIEEFRDELQELVELATGKFISRETARRAVEASLKRLGDGSPIIGDRQLLNVGTAQRGSAAALTPFLQRFSKQQNNEEKMLDAQEEANQTLEEIHKVLKDRPQFVLQPVGL